MDWDKKEEICKIRGTFVKFMMNKDEMPCGRCRIIQNGRLFGNIELAKKNGTSNYTTIEVETTSK